MIHADGGILHRKQTSATAVHNRIRRMNNDRGGSDNNNQIQKSSMQQKRQCCIRYDTIDEPWTVEHQWSLWHHRCLQHIRSRRTKCKEATMCGS